MVFAGTPGRIDDRPLPPTAQQMNASHQFGSERDHLTLLHRLHHQDQFVTTGRRAEEGHGAPHG